MGLTETFFYRGFKNLFADFLVAKKTGNDILDCIFKDSIVFFNEMESFYILLAIKYVLKYCNQ